MTQINAYLTFDGNCREAMTFYKDCIGGELTLMTFADAPGSAEMPENIKQQIMHCHLVKGGLVLMASDRGPMTNHKLVQGDTVTLSLNCSSEEEINTFFSKLSAGGQITMPLGEQFWGAIFGMFTDKFGMHWMLNYDKAPKQ